MVFNIGEPTGEQRLDREEIFNLMVGHLDLPKQASVDDIKKEFTAWERQWDAALFSEGTSFRKRLEVDDYASQMDVFEAYLRSDLGKQDPKDYNESHPAIN